MTPARRGYGWTALVGLGLGGVIATVVHAPARWLDVALQRASAGQVRLLHPQGTLWQGSGTLWVRGDGGALTLPGPLRWTLRPTLTDTAQGLTWTLHLPCCAPRPLQGFVGRTQGAVWLQTQAWQAALALDTLQALGAPWNTLGLQGRAVLDLQAVRWPLGNTASAPTWHLEVVALDVASAASPLRPLGSYHITFAGQATQPPRMTVTTLHGDLRLQAEGAWAGGRLNLRGVAEANPERLDALSNLLNLLGRRDGTRAHLSIGSPP